MRECGSCPFFFFFFSSYRQLRNLLGRTALVREEGAKSKVQRLISDYGIILMPGFRASWLIGGETGAFTLASVWRMLGFPSGSSSALDSGVAIVLSPSFTRVSCLSRGCTRVFLSRFVRRITLCSFLKLILVN